MDQELDMERRQVQSDQMSCSTQVKASGRVVTAFCLWQGNMSVCGGCLPGEGRGCSAEKWPYLSWAGLLVLGIHRCFLYGKKNSCFWPFKMGSIVQSIFISLWCVCFASAEAKCHICHVCSGFYSLLLIILYRPMREPASISMNWQAHVLFSLPECTGLLVSWQFFLCIVWWWLFFPNIFGGPLIFNDIMEITNFDHDP